MVDTETADLTLTQFVALHNIRMTSRRVDSNPLMGDRDMDHWRCTLTCEGRRMSTTFSKGFGHNGAKPRVEELLSTFASDTTALDSNFEDWCGEYGYEQDSRKAYKIYQACVKQSQRLRTFLGSSEVYNALVFHTDRY